MAPSLSLPLLTPAGGVGNCAPARYAGSFGAFGMMIQSSR